MAKNRLYAYSVHALAVEQNGETYHLHIDRPVATRLEACQMAMDALEEFRAGRRYDIVQRYVNGTAWVIVWVFASDARRTDER